MHTSTSAHICVLAHPCVLDGFGRGGDQPILCVSVLTYWTENTRFDTPQPNDSPAGAPGSHAGSLPTPPRGTRLHTTPYTRRAAAGGVWEFCAFWSAADFVASTYGRDLIWQFWREGRSTHEFWSCGSEGASLPAALSIVQVRRARIDIFRYCSPRPHPDGSRTPPPTRRDAGRPLSPPRPTPGSSKCRAP